MLFTSSKMTNPLGISDDEYNRFIKVLIGASAAVYIIGVIGHFVFVKPSKKEGLEQIVKESEEKYSTTKVKDTKTVKDKTTGRTYILNGNYAIDEEVKKEIRNIKEKLSKKISDEKIYGKILEIYYREHKKRSYNCLEYKGETYKKIDKEILNTKTNEKWIKELKKLLDDCHLPKKHNPPTYWTNKGKQSKRFEITRNQRSYVYNHKQRIKSFYKRKNPKC